MLLAYTPTPIQEIQDPLFKRTAIRVLIKREDLNHPFISGNKWWKLKYNLEEAKKSGNKTVLTFGGAYSNHIYAMAAAAHELGFESIGIIRGEETLPLNETLSFARKCGMSLHYISREAYRNKENARFIKDLHDQWGDFYMIPEGGTNELAVSGVEEFALTLGSDFEYLCCAVGTGGTLAGLIRGLKGEKEILGFPVLKGGEFLRAEVRKWLSADFSNWKLITDYHFGGYGKYTEELLAFINSFQSHTNIPLDRVYTGKVLWGVYDLVRKDYFRPGSRVLVLHSGGLQGGIQNL